MALFILLPGVGGRELVRGCTQCWCPCRQLLLGAGNALPILLPETPTMVELDDLRGLFQPMIL